MSLHRTSKMRIDKIHSFRKPDIDKDTFETINKWIEEEIEPVKQEEIDKIKRALKLYDISLNNPKYTMEQKKNIIKLKCEQVYILYNLQARQWRQKETNKIMDKMDWVKISKDMYDMGIRF
jgi:hypothetical protein